MKREKLKASHQLKHTNSIEQMTMMNPARMPTNNVIEEPTQLLYTLSFTLLFPLLVYIHV